MYNIVEDLFMVRLLISEPSLILESKLNAYTKAVIEEKDEFNYNVFDFEENSFEEIVDALQTPSFSSEKKVVIAKNPYFIKDSKVKLPFTNDIKTLEEYINNQNPDSEFIIICPKKYNTNKSKFINLISKVGKVENLLLEDENEFIAYGDNLIEKTNIDISSKAKDILYIRCANDVCKLEREIAKLAIFNDTIDEEIIDKMVSRPLEDDVFELSNALLNKDHKKTMKIYSDLKLLKIEPINLIALLANQFRLILQVLILRKENKKEADIASLLDVHPYRVKMAIKHGYNYSLKDIKQILVDLATLDAKIKTGEADRYVDFELFLATK